MEKVNIEQLLNSVSAEQLNSIPNIKEELNKLMQLADQFETETRTYNQKTKNLKKSGAEFANTGIVSDPTVSKGTQKQENIAATQLIQINQKFNEQLGKLVVILETNPQATSAVPQALREPLKKALEDIRNNYNKQLNEVAALDHSLKSALTKPIEPAPTNRRMPGSQT